VFCLNLICAELTTVAFSALIQQRRHLACKNWMVGGWHGYMSGVRCRFAYGPPN